MSIQVGQKEQSKFTNLEEEFLVSRMPRGSSVQKTREDDHCEEIVGKKRENGEGPEIENGPN